MATEKRLIDANAMREDWLTNGENEDVYDTNAILDSIDAQPTVDAVEVVHGRWIHVPSSDMMTGKAYKCSECGKMRYGSYMPNYCQVCGAKMDMEVDK